MTVGRSTACSADIGFSGSTRSRRWSPGGASSRSGSSRSVNDQPTTSITPRPTGAVLGAAAQALCAG